MPVNRNAISAPEPPRYFKPKKYFLLAVITANLLMILVAIFSVDIIAERAFTEKARGGRGNSSSSFSTTTTRPSRAKTIEEIERSKVSAKNLHANKRNLFRTRRFTFAMSLSLPVLDLDKVHRKDAPLQRPLLWPDPRAALLRRHPPGEHLAVDRLRRAHRPLQCLPRRERLHRPAGRPGGDRLRPGRHRRPPLRPRSGALSTDQQRRRWWWWWRRWSWWWCCCTLVKVLCSALILLHTKLIFETTTSFISYRCPCPPKTKPTNHKPLRASIVSIATFFFCHEPPSSPPPPPSNRKRKVIQKMESERVPRYFTMLINNGSLCKACTGRQRSQAGAHFDCLLFNCNPN